MADIGCQTKPNSTTTSSPALKLFGFNISEGNNGHTEKSSSGFSGINGFQSGDGRKYECQYCCREFANSQALGGHQNAHKKERLILKRAAQMQANRGLLTSHVHSAFSRPPHLLSLPVVPLPQHPPQSPSWVYVSYPYGPSSGPVRRVYAASDSEMNTSMGDGDGGHGLDELGLNLHLSLGPTM
ncbi:zinc finger protein 6-like [Tripterygium wilfordii]|nr:zinc finger protein 6-like [Tripterygium wilfordii]